MQSESFPEQEYLGRPHASGLGPEEIDHSDKHKVATLQGTLPNATTNGHAEQQSTQQQAATPQPQSQPQPQPVNDSVSIVGTPTAVSALAQSIAPPSVPAPPPTTKSQSAPEHTASSSGAKSAAVAARKSSVSPHPCLFCKASKVKCDTGVVPWSVEKRETHMKQTMRTTSQHQAKSPFRTESTN